MTMPLLLLFFWFIRKIDLLQTGLQAIYIPLESLLEATEDITTAHLPIGELQGIQGSEL